MLPQQMPQRRTEYAFGHPHRKRRPQVSPGAGWGEDSPLGMRREVELEMSEVRVFRDLEEVRMARRGLSCPAWYLNKRAV